MHFPSDTRDRSAAPAASQTKRLSVRSTLYVNVRVCEMWDMVVVVVLPLAVCDACLSNKAAFLFLPGKFNCYAIVWLRLKQTGKKFPRF